MYTVCISNKCYKSTVIYHLPARVCRAGGCAQLCRQPLLGIRCQEILYLAHGPRFGQDHKRETVENTLISKLMYSSERSMSRANLIRTCAEFCDLKLSTSKSTVQTYTNYCTEILRRGARTTPAKCDQIKIDKSAKTRYIVNHETKRNGMAR